MAKVTGSERYSPLCLLSIFRRFFFLEAQEKDKTRSLYKDLPQICDSPDDLKNALAYVIFQNLHVTQRCGEVLSSAFPLSGSNRKSLKEFAEAERGHDKIMLHALQAFPIASLKPWAKEPHPATKALMDLFLRIAENNFLAFAFSIYLFERPHVEDIHPLTTLLTDSGFPERQKGERFLNLFGIANYTKPSLRRNWQQFTIVNLRS
jgi:hypothetical protein